MRYQNVIPDPDEIDQTLNDAMERVDEGSSAFPGMLYEEGIRDTIAWLFDGDINPLAGHVTPSED